MNRDRSTSRSGGAPSTTARRSHPQTVGANICISPWRPTQNVTGDQAVTAQRRGEASDQRDEQDLVGPVQTRPRVGCAKYRGFMAQDEQLDVFVDDVARASSINQLRSGLKIR